MHSVKRAGDVADCTCPAVACDKLVMIVDGQVQNRACFDSCGRVPICCLLELT